MNCHEGSYIPSVIELVSDMARHESCIMPFSAGKGIARKDEQTACICEDATRRVQRMQASMTNMKKVLEESMVDIWFSLAILGPTTTDQTNQRIDWFFSLSSRSNVV